MSGSPCSIGGRLVGALSYAFAAFAKEPIAGVTPISDMLDVLDLPDEARPWRLAKAVDNSDASWKAFAEGEAAPVESTSPGRPIQSPLSMVGVTPTVREHFAPWFESMGFMPMAAGQSGKAQTTDGTLEPGGAIAAVLVRGDVEIAATGTVTTVDGNKVTAFGHPFMGSGAVSFPMAQATILNTMASAQRSFKMSQTGAMVGELTQDRLPAITGILGQEAEMLEVQGTVTTAATKDTFQFEVARDPGLSPRFVAVGLASVFGGRIDAGKRGLVRIRARVEAEGTEPVALERVYSSERDSNLSVYAAMDVARTVATLWSTPFGPPPKLKVFVDATIDPNPAVELIDSIALGESHVRVGDTVNMHVRLRRVDGPESVAAFKLKVPRTWAGQRVELVAASGAQADMVAQVLEGRPSPNNIEQVARWLRGRRADGFLYVLAIRKGVGLQAEVDAMRFLPGSAVTTLGGTPSRQLMQVGLTWEERSERPGMVLGAARTTLGVMPN